MSLQQVEVKREEVLTIVKNNKQKHDKILADAIERYWLSSEKTLRNLKIEKLKQLKKQYQKSVKDFKKQINKDLDLVSKRNKSVGFFHLTSQYPEDHTEDYNSVIKKLELCVGDTVELDSDEFDQYIRNMWEWRNSFLSINTSYNVGIGTTSPSSKLYMSNGCPWSNRITGSYETDGYSEVSGIQSPTHELTENNIDF